jgi:outer membrane protein
MSRALLATGLSLGFLGLLGSAAQAQGGATTLKLAYIRGQDILAQTPGRAEAEAQFNKEVDAARAQEKLWGDSINVMVADYGKSEATLSADQKASRQQAIREKQASFDQRRQALEQQVQQRQGELVQPILQRVNGIIEQVRAEQGYSMVFDAQAGGGGLVAADKALDITDQVVAKLKAAGPVSSGAGQPSTTRPASRPSTGPTAAPSGVSRPKNPS